MSSPTIFGNFAIDDLVFADGSTRWASPGGTAAFATLGAALWTGSAAAVAPIGDDFPLAMLEGVDCSRCRKIPHTMRNWGLYEENGERHFIARNRDRDWLSFCPNVADVSSGEQSEVHIAPLPPELVQPLIEDLRRTGTQTISLDLDDHDLRGAMTRDLHLELIRAVDIYMPSEQDVRSLFPSMEPVVTLRHLREHAPSTRLIAIKLGAAGVVAHVAGESKGISIQSVAERVGDATGAGDSFCGGVLAGFAMGLDPVDALLRGTVSAACCVEQLGFTGLVGVETRHRQERLAQVKTRSFSM